MQQEFYTHQRIRERLAEEVILPVAHQVHQEIIKWLHQDRLTIPWEPLDLTVLLQHLEQVVLMC